VKLNLANRITISRILLILPFVGLMLKINDPALSQNVRTALRLIAMVVYVVMAVSDGLDGYLARKRHEITSLGKFLDPVADKLLTTSACLLLTSRIARVEGFPLPTTVVVLIVGKDLFLLIGFFVVYMVTSRIHIVPVFMGKTATMLQNCMVTGILIAPEASRLIGGWVWLLRVFWWSAAAVAVLATLIYTRNGSRYVAQYEHELSNNHA